MHAPVRSPAVVIQFTFIASAEPFEVDLDDMLDPAQSLFIPRLRAHGERIAVDADRAPAPLETDLSAVVGTLDVRVQLGVRPRLGAEVPEELDEVTARAIGLTRLSATSMAALLLFV